MSTHNQILSHLYPPVKHEMIQDGDRVTVLLIDETLGVEAQRSLASHELDNPDFFRMIILYAVNELRSKGSCVKLTVLPYWD